MVFFLFKGICLAAVPFFDNSPKTKKLIYFLEIKCRCFWVDTVPLSVFSDANYPVIQVIGKKHRNHCDRV